MNQTVYKWEMYSIECDNWVSSNRWGTKEGIEKLNGRIIPTSKIELEIDPNDLNQWDDGIAPTDYTPDTTEHTQEFQTEVRSEMRSSSEVKSIFQCK